MILIQVNKIEVQYDKTSKQVDVQALKTTLWSHMQKAQQVSEQVSISGSAICQLRENNYNAAFYQ